MNSKTLESTLMLISLAVAPVLIFLHAVYIADRYEKEPIKNLFRYLLAGGVATAGVLLSDQLLPFPHPPRDANWIPLFSAFVILIRVALVEETAKRIALWYSARRDRELNEPFDWIVYSVSIALGFALVENIMYVLRFGFPTAIVRAFTAVPSHALNGTLMGDRLARAAESKGRSANLQRCWAIAEPTLWHALYDFVAINGGESGIGLIVAVVFVQYFVALPRVQKQQQVARSGLRLPPIMLPDKFLSIRIARAKRRAKKS